MPERLSEIRAQVDPVLTNFAIGFKPQRNLIGGLVAPSVSVTTTKGTILSFGKEGFRVYNTERALRADPKRVEFALSKDSYVTDEHALSTMLDHREIEEARAISAGAVLDMENKAVMLVQNSLELGKEKAVADSVFGAGNYHANHKVTLSGNDQWRVAGGGQGSTSTPIADIQVGIDQARSAMGVEPNTIVFGYNAWASFKRHSDLLDKIKYSQRAVVTPEIAANVLEIPNVRIGKSVYSSDGSTFTDLWGDSVALLYVPEQDELVEGTTPHTATFNKLGYPRVMTWEDALRKHFMVQRDYQVKLISNTYGYLIIDVDALN